jgi:hypothetical protein
MLKCPLHSGSAKEQSKMSCRVAPYESENLGPPTLPFLRSLRYLL